MAGFPRKGLQQNPAALWRSCTFDPQPGNAHETDDTNIDWPGKQFAYIERLHKNHPAFYISVSQPFKGCRTSDYTIIVNPYYFMYLEANFILA